MTRLALLLCASLAVLAAGAAHTPANADAKVPIRIGIGDQQVAMFDQQAFQRAHFKRVRYFIAWNAIDAPGALAAADAYVRRARQSGISVLLHVSSDDLRIKRARLPSVAEYRSKVGALVRHFRTLGVREFGVFNEANHASQPTYRSPSRAAAFFRAMYRIVKPGCRSCAIVALDVLDQAGVQRYIRSFYRSLSPTYRRRATIVGIHNYGDVNRRRTTFTRSIINESRAFNRRTRFWFTETGGIVKFAPSFPCSTSRAALRLRTMFSLAKRFRTRGVDRVYIYNWTGAGCSARFDAGLTNPDGSTRPGYTYLRRVLPLYLR